MDLVFYPPYDIETFSKCTFERKRYVNSSGVYLIKINERIVYVGRSNCDLYNRAYRHFQSPASDKYGGKTYFDVAYCRYTFKISLCLIKHQRPKELELFLIRKLKPRDNRKFYENEAGYFF